MRVLLYVIIVVFFAGCTFDKGAVPLIKAPCDTTLTYSSDIQALITLNCTDPGCHQTGSAEGDLTHYNGLRTKVDNGSLRQRVVVHGTMPPTAPLSNDDKRKIECWIENGAPEN